VRVLLDRDLAWLYGVTVKQLNQQVRRNVSRFPADFMFRLAWKEVDSLMKSADEVNRGRGLNRKYLPLAFTEQGVAMLSSVLNSERAIQVNIGIMRAFVRMRHAAVEHRKLSERIDLLESKTDARFEIVFGEMQRMNEADERRERVPRRRRIGFQAADASLA
jgi:hypothetical protein